MFSITGSVGTRASFWVNILQAFDPSSVRLKLDPILPTGWWAVMSQAAFSFVGTEIVAVCRESSVLFSVVLTPIRLTDCCRRSKEPAKKSSKSDQAGVHPYSPFLYWRNPHYSSFHLFCSNIFDVKNDSRDFLCRRPIRLLI